MIVPTGDIEVDTAAIQAAHDELPWHGGRIVLDAGVFVVGPLVFSKRVHVCGAGPSGLDDQGGTVLFYPHATGTAITSGGSCSVFTDVGLVASWDCRTADGLVVSGAQTRMDRIAVAGFRDDITCRGAVYWSLRDSCVSRPKRYGLRVLSPDHPDAGDCVIDGCWFTAETNLDGHNPSAAVRWESGGGLRFVNNKINGRVSSGRFGAGVEFAMQADAATADLFVQHNSIENVRRVGVSAYCDAGTVWGLMVTGNEFMSVPTAVQVGAGMPSALVAHNIGANIGRGVVSTGACRITQSANVWEVAR